MKIAIEIDAAGQFKLTGDAVLRDKIASLGLIEFAKGVILSQPVAQAAAGIEVPNAAAQRSLLNAPPGTNGHHGG